MSSENGDLMTVKEAAHILNLSERTVWKYIQNRSLKASRKITTGKKPMVMVFEKSISELLRSRNIEPSTGGSMNNPEQVQYASGNVQNASEKPYLIPLQHYEEQRSQWLQERDQLQAGLLMYRYKFEELDRQVKMLPAPVEIIPNKLTELETKTAELVEKDQALMKSQETVKALEEALQRERQRSWWERLWKK